MPPQRRPNETVVNGVPGGLYEPKVPTHGWELNSVLKFNNGEPVNSLSGSDKWYWKVRGPWQHRCSGA
jgi:hypothetical protein